MEDTILLNHPLGQVEYTREELEQQIIDYNFLMDAFLVLLNEEVASKSDLPFNKKEVIEYAKEMYMKSSFSKEFIEKIFNQ